ncbi:WXG100 family type VII secretion target [Leucobacter albus]|uniref:WXG100 family type VII secretion target n=1 Tax=Leucobacter albus TaxID=272210 RepID=A0ABW3TPK0_9MICO
MTGSNPNDFWLLPSGLEQQAGGFEKWQSAFKGMNDVLKEIVPYTEDNAEIFNYAIGRYSEMHTGVLKWITHMQNVFAGVATELRDVAREGRTIDMEQAARIDKYSPTEYNGHDPNPGGGYGGGAGKIAPEYDRWDSPEAPMYEPNRGGGALFYLDPGPGAFDGASDFTKRLLPGDLASPSEWVSVVLENIGATTFRETVLSGFGGDWVALRTHAARLQGTSTFLGDAHSAMTSNVGAVLVYWQGLSANSASAYFDEMLTGIAGARDGAAKAATAVNEYCDAVKEAAEVVAGIVDGFRDSVIIAAVTLAAGGKNPLTAVLSKTAAGVAMLNAWRLWSKINDHVQKLQTIKQGLSVIQGLTTSMDDFTSKLHVPVMAETS